MAQEKIEHPSNGNIYWDYCTLAGAKNTTLFSLGAAAPIPPLTPHIM